MNYTYTLLVSLLAVITNSFAADPIQITVARQDYPRYLYMMVPVTLLMKQVGNSHFSTGKHQSLLTAQQMRNMIDRGYHYTPTTLILKVKTCHIIGGKLCLQSPNGGLPEDFLKATWYVLYDGVIDWSAQEAISMCAVLFLEGKPEFYENAPIE